MELLQVLQLVTASILELVMATLLELASVLVLELVMALALVLVGCAGNRVNQPSESSLADLRARLSMGQCTPELTAQVIAAQQAPLHLEAAYQCLTNARLELSEQLLSDYRNSFAQRAE